MEDINELFDASAFIVRIKQVALANCPDCSAIIRVGSPCSCAISSPGTSGFAITQAVKLAFCESCQKPYRQDSGCSCAQSAEAEYAPRSKSLANG